MTASLPSLGHALRAAARTYGAHTAIRFGDRATDYAALDRQTDAVAAALAARGLRKGDRVGLYCPNADVFVQAYFGILKAGATVVPLNLLLNPKEVAYILNDAGARALLYHEAFAEQVRALTPLVKGLDFRIAIGAQKADAADGDWPAFLAHDGTAPEIAYDPADDVAVLLYTSGTTGFPKGAMLTHRNLLANVSSLWQAVKLEAGRETFLVVLPMFHAFAATACMLAPLLHGCAIVPVPRFEPAQVAALIETLRITVFMAVPSMYTVLLRLPAECTPKLRPLKCCVSGGAALPVEVLNQFEARYGIPIYEGDGPTECSPVTCVNPIGGVRKPGTVGPPVPDVAMKIMDEQGRELPRGQVGEICVRGPNVMKGYWKRPEETREAFFGDWFRTGDLGTEDTDGYFSIVDRKKDLVIVNGMNVYPRVIEEVLYRCPAVREAAVVGAPHKLHGEIPVAYVALKDGATATAKDLDAFCREHLGRHEIPRRFHVLPELPKNAAGKILKRALRTQGEVERGIEPTPAHP